MPPSTKTSKAQDAQTPPALDGASSVFAGDLGRDENLLWQSRAGAGPYAVAHMRAVFMGLSFFIVAIVWHAMVKRGGMMTQLDLATWLFAIVGAYYVAVPLWAFVKAKWFVFYALTNQRLIILQVFPKHRVQSFPIKTLNRVVAHNVHTGDGTLLIDAPGAVSKNPATPRAGFYGVRYVSKVVEAVQTLQDPEAALERAQALQAQKLKQTQPQQSAEAARFAPSSHAPSSHAASPTSTNASGQTLH